MSKAHLSIIYPFGYLSTLIQNKNFTLFIMGFTIPEKTHQYLPMQEMKFRHMFTSQGVTYTNIYFWFKVMNFPIYSIEREVIKEFESLKSQI